MRLIPPLVLVHLLSGHPDQLSQLMLRQPE
jgi:hypothetical protein